MSIEDYLDAREAFERIQREAAHLGLMLEQIGRSIREKPSRMIFSNSSGGLPPGANMSRDSVSYNASQFPTVDAIMNLLERWHEAKARCANAWGEIPKDRQRGLQPPPPGVMPPRY